jgi:thioredoxin-like negative regulator of GroEL
MQATAPTRLAEIPDAAALIGLVSDPARPALVLFDTGSNSPGRHLEARLLRLPSDEAMTLARVDVDRLPDVAQRFGINGVPALVLFRSGHVVASRLGDIPDQDLEDWLASESAV